MARLAICSITEDPIDADAVRRAVASEEAGAIAVFCGDVRRFDGGREVRSLAYEAHPSAETVLRELAERMLAGVLAIAIAHRVGAVPIGDSALVAAVAAEHRGPAFDVCRELVELVKAELPIWKHQVFADGTEEWVNSP